MDKKNIRKYLYMCALALTINGCTLNNSDNQREVRYEAPEDYLITRDDKGNIICYKKTADGIEYTEPYVYYVDDNYEDLDDTMDNNINGSYVR